MNISKIGSNQTFGKEEIMACKIKNNKSNSLNDATLYKLNPEDKNDRNDVYYSKQTACIAKNFEMAMYDSFESNKDFYMLKDDNTGEVISCAETSHRFRPFSVPYPGQYTLIEEAKENNKYQNGFEPLFAYVTKCASNSGDNSVLTAFDENSVEGLKNYNLSKLETGEYIIPQKNFSTLINNAEEKYEMEYFV